MIVRFLAVAAVTLLASSGFAQMQAVPGALGYSDTFQVDYMPSSTAGNFVNLTNVGFYSSFLGGGAPSGYICANIYTYQPNQEPRNCCSCPLSENALRHLTAADLAPSAFAAPAPVFNNFTIKIVATLPPGGNPAACNAAIAGGAPGTPGGFATGLRAWATKVHRTTPTGTLFYTETQFSHAPLSQGEYSKLVGLCSLFQRFGTGAGICGACSLGARAPGAVL